MSAATCGTWAIENLNTDSKNYQFHGRIFMIKIGGMNSNFSTNSQALFGISCKAGKARMKCNSVDFAQWHSQRVRSNPPHPRFLFFVILLSVLVARTSLLYAASTRQQDAEQLKSLIDELNGRGVRNSPSRNSADAAPVDRLPFTPDQKTLTEG